MKKESFVYIALRDDGRGSFYVKIGKSNHPERRAKAYQTHCPGGLDSMYAARVPSVATAFAAESRVMAKLRALDGIAPVGGEWFRVGARALDDAFRVFIDECGEPYSICLERGHRVANWAA